MIWAAIAAAIAVSVTMSLSGASDIYLDLMKQWDKSVQKRVKDPVRLARAQAISADSKASALELQRRLNEDIHTFREINRDYNTPKSEYDAFAERLSDGALTSARALTDSFRLLHDALTPEEFDAVFGDFVKQVKKSEKKLAKQQAKAEKKAKKSDDMNDMPMDWAPEDAGRYM